LRAQHSVKRIVGQLTANRLSYGQFTLPGFIVLHALGEQLQFLDCFNGFICSDRGYQCSDRRTGDDALEGTLGRAGRAIL